MLSVPLLLVLALLAVATVPFGALAQPQRMIRVDVRFEHAGAERGEGVQGGGGVIITERGRMRPRGHIGAGSTDTRTRQSTSIFTLVQDGGESTLTVTTHVPYPQVAFYRDYATGAGYPVHGVVFRDVGTSLKVRANVLPGNQIHVRLTPSISWLSADASGAIEFTEAATEVVVTSGQPVIVAGSNTHTHAITREILGVTAREVGAATTVMLTATPQ